MTDRLRGVYVTFERDIRVDDAEAVLAAIRQFRGVLSVKGDVADGFAEHVARQRVARVLWEKFLAIHDELAKG